MTVDSYFAAKKALSEYFEHAIYDDVEDQRDQFWAIGPATVNWEPLDDLEEVEDVTEIKYKYAEDINFVKVQGDDVLVQFRTCTGDGDAYMIFDKKKCFDFGA